MPLSDRCCVLRAAVWCVLLCLARVLLTTGNYENSPFDHGPRYLAIYANHSTQPNAKFESVKVRKPGPLGLKYRMLLVSTEPIEAGCEIRVNYDAGLGRGDQARRPGGARCELGHARSREGASCE